MPAKGSSSGRVGGGARGGRHAAPGRKSGYRTVKKSPTRESADGRRVDAAAVKRAKHAKYKGKPKPTG